MSHATRAGSHSIGIEEKKRNRRQSRDVHTRAAIRIIRACGAQAHARINANEATQPDNTKHTASTQTQGKHRKSKIRQVKSTNKRMARRRRAKSEGARSLTSDSSHQAAPGTMQQRTCSAAIAEVRGRAPNQSSRPGVNHSRNARSGCEQPRATSTSVKGLCTELL